MATPRGGSKFFRAMGQSAASRGLSAGGQGLLHSAPETAVSAFHLGFNDQRRDNRPRSQYMPLFEDKPFVTTIRPDSAPFTVHATLTVSDPVPSIIKVVEHEITLALVRKLRAEGVSVRGCAKQLDIPESTIRGWLKKEVQ